MVLKQFNIQPEFHCPCLNNNECCRVLYVETHLLIYTQRSHSEKTFTRWECVVHPNKYQQQVRLSVHLNANVMLPLTQT